MNPIYLFFHKTGSPPWFYKYSGYLIPWLWVGFIVLTVIGLYLGLFVAPADYQQGESVRIMYLHVPAAWMSMMIYGLMAVWGFIALVWRIRIMEVLVISSAPVGAAFTMIALITGSLWGRHGDAALRLHLLPHRDGGADGICAGAHARASRDRLAQAPSRR